MRSETKTNFQNDRCIAEEGDMEPVYYVKCSYCWPEFVDRGCFVYSEVHFCDYAKKLDCTTLEEAEAIAAQMNETEECPVCHHRHKFKATTNFDMMNEKDLADRLINNSKSWR